MAQSAVVFANRYSNPAQRSAADNLLTSDRNKESNCFTIGRHTFDTGIRMSIEKGPDLLRPWQPSIPIGNQRVYRDGSKSENKSPFGCIYHPNGDHAMLYRASLTAVPGKKFFRLRRPEVDEPEESILRVNVGMPHNAKVRIGEHMLRVQYGIQGSSDVIERSGQDMLILLRSGQHASLLFPDGWVRKFRQKGNLFTEEKLSSAEMARIRIQDARLHLAAVANLRDVEERTKRIQSILYGMADLLHLTTFDRFAGQDVRRSIIQGFFLELESDHLSLAHRKLTAVLHAVDEALVPLLRSKQKIVEPVDLSRLAEHFNVTPMRRGKTERKGASPAKSKLRKAQKSERDRQQYFAKQGGQTKTKK